MNTRISYLRSHIANFEQKKKSSNKSFNKINRDEVVQCSAWFLAGGVVSGAGGRAYWV
jgi:hypothetical protein